MVTVAIAQNAKIDIAIREALDHLACESFDPRQTRRGETERHVGIGVR